MKRNVQPRNNKYTYLSYNKIVTRLQELAQKYPNICQVYTAQDLYQLPNAGECKSDKAKATTAKEDVNNKDTDKCKQYIVEVGNFNKLDKSAPQVFYSGALHGNERIGPTAVVEFITYLVEEYEFDANVRRLVDTRLTVAMPMPNGWGYYHNKREEINIDPNRDFAFNTSPDRCMESIAARAINEVWINHVFQLGVTYHGGDNLIGYPWGDQTHCKHGSIRKSPYSRCSNGFIAGDKIAMHGLGEFLVHVCGKGFGGDGLYKLGEMNDVIYPVEGGMEDWAYGGSWHSEKTTCKPKTYNGYAKEKTTYKDETLRTVLYLIETADEKIPNQNTLGLRYHRSLFSVGSKNAVSKMEKNNMLLYPGTVGDGHIPRNIRLSLGVLNAVEPYIKIKKVNTISNNEKKKYETEIKISVNGVEKIDDIVCKASDIITCHISNDPNKENWMPYGGLSIDDNHISLKIVIEINSPVKFKQLLLMEDKDEVTTKSAALAYEKHLTIQIGIKSDSHWKKIPPKSSDKVHESHWVNVRTNPKYNIDSKYAKISGKDIWYSEPFNVADKFDDAIRDKIRAERNELQIQNEEKPSEIKNVVSLKQNVKHVESIVHTTIIWYGTIGILIFVYLFLRKRWKKTKKINTRT